MAVGFYKMCEGIIWQWNFINSARLYRGSGIFITARRYTLAVEFCKGCEVLLWHLNCIYSMKLCCGSGIVLTV